MLHGRWAAGFLIACGLGVSNPVSLNAQARENGAERTTLSGVYTAAQAMRGEDTFAGMCQGCHTPASHATAAFVNAWRDRPLLDLYRYLTEAMPKSDPGTLTPTEYAQVLAYLLKLNGMPPGQEELPADTAVLQSIWFEPKK